MDLVKVLEKLSAAPGPAGMEGGAAEVAIALLQPYMDDVSVDVMGNVIGLKSCGKPGAKRVLLEAHLDEIGFVVTGTKDGFLTLAAVGSIDPRYLPGAQLQVLTNPPRPGVFACLPPHVLTPEDMKKGLELEDMALDVGLSDEEAKKIPLGTPVIFDLSPMAMGEGLFCGKSLDNRASIAAIVLALHRTADKPAQVDIQVVFSSQEEIGCRGAEPVLYALNPDYFLAVDVTFAQTPDVDTCKALPMKSGAAIGIGPFLNRNLTARLKKLAEAGGIPHEMEVLPSRTGTTADKGQISRAGVPTALISLPLKYMHCPREIVCLSDIEAVADLIAAFIQDIGGGENYA